jgi:hypothetical protein
MRSRKRMCESVIGLFTGRDVASTVGGSQCRTRSGVTPAKAIEKRGRSDSPDQPRMVLIARTTPKQPKWACD